MGRSDREVTMVSCKTRIVCCFLGDYLNGPKVRKRICGETLRLQRSPDKPINLCSLVHPYRAFMHPLCTLSQAPLASVMHTVQIKLPSPLLHVSPILHPALEHTQLPISGLPPHILSSDLPVPEIQMNSKDHGR